MNRQPPAGETGSNLGIRVNPIVCTAFGFCAEYAPELFALDEWGYAWPHRREAPAGLEELARQAAALCPRRAILLEERRAPGGAAGPARKESLR